MGGQSIPNFEYALAKGVHKTFVISLAKYITVLLDSEGIFINVEGRSVAEKYIKNGIRNHTEVNKYYEFNNIPDHYPIALVSIINEYLETYMPINISKIDATGIANFAIRCAILETKRETSQALEATIHNLNSMHSRAGAQTPFSSINYGTDTTDAGRLVIKATLDAVMAGLGNGETAIFPISIFRVKDGINFKPGDPNYDLYRYSMEVTAKRLFPNYLFLDAPFNLKYFDPEDIRTWSTTMGCRTRVLANVNGPSFSHGRGNLSFTTINLPRIAIKNSKDMEAFYNELAEKLDIAEDQLHERYLYQARHKARNFPFLMSEGLWMDSDKLGPDDTLFEVLKHGTLSIGFIGLAETLIMLTGKHHGESAEAQKLGLEIVKFMRDWCDAAVVRKQLNYSLLATPSENLAGRFIKIDKVRYGIIPGVTDKEYYTNSYHVPVYYNIDAFSKIDIEAPYHDLCNAGHISYIEMDGDPSKNIDAIEQCLAHMKEKGIGYGSINHPVDRDPVCGYTGIIDDVCPRCGRREGEAIPVERLKKLGAYKNVNLDTRGCCGNPDEERDRTVNPVIQMPTHIKE